MRKISRLLLALLILIGCGTMQKTPPEWGTWPNHWHTDGAPAYLKWRHSPGSDVTGYTLYWGCKVCPGYKKLKDGTYEVLDNNCRNDYWYGNRNVGHVTEYEFPVEAKLCRKYMFALTAYNRDGTESDRSPIRYYTTDKLDPNLPAPSPIILTGWDQWDGTEYASSDNLTMTWDIMPRTNYYEVQMVHTDDSAHQTTYNMGTTTENSITVTRPRAGHFIAMVRACNTAGCSIWSQSIDPTYAIVDGNPGAWRVFWKLAPPIWEM